MDAVASTQRFVAATVADLVANAAATLIAAGIESPRREARLLLAHVSGLDPAALLRRGAEPLEAPGLDRLVARRAAREPLAFIVGHQPFWTLDLLVSPDTLIPRADSEAVIEAAVLAFPRRDARRVLDLGTGTGCLLLAALTELPDAWGVGIDRIPAAAALARQNAARNGLAARARFLCGDWAAPIAGRFDLVLANPPYIETAVIGGLMPEVSVHEPWSALDGGADGLDAYRALMTAFPILLSPGGVAICEFGAGQAADVAELAEAAGLRPGEPQTDLSGIARVLPVRCKKPFGECARGQ